MSTSPTSDSGAAEWTAGDESYSSQLQEVLNSDSDHSGDLGMDEGDDEFIYTGVDSETRVQGLGGYHEQLADALGGEGEIDVPENDENDSVSWEVDSESKPKLDISLAGTSDGEAETTARSKAVLPKHHSHSLLHPTISRLRSFTPSRLPSSSSVNSAISPSPFGGLSPSPSHFSEISRAPSTVSDTPITHEPRPQGEETAKDAFRWTTLRIISNQVFSTTSQKASIVLGSSWGNPTVLAANGLICIGTDQGKVLVYDFSQQFRFVCGGEVPASKPIGAVSSLALSHDHSFLAVGYSTGHINIFDLSHPQTPARSVPTTTLAAVTAGRKEGHLYGSAVTSLGFVGARHTAIVSADDNGLAFYHSLGKVLFVEANDVLRVLGKYPDEEPVLPAKEATIPVKSPDFIAAELPSAGRTTRGLSKPSNLNEDQPLAHHVASSSSNQKRSSAAILSMAPLPLGTSPHPTDSYSLIALLTPIKLVVVGLKPTPRMWLRRLRTEIGVAAGESENRGKGAEERYLSKRRGCLAWYPSVINGSSSFFGSSAIPSTSMPSDDAELSGFKQSKPGTSTKQSNPNALTEPPISSTPMLAYSWGSTLKLVRIKEEKRRQQVNDPKSVRQKKVIEVGHVVFEDIAQWESDKDIMAMQWLNVEQLLVLTTTSLDVYEVRSAKRVERLPLNVHSLTSYPPGTPSPVSQDLSPECSLSHSMKVYKGKVFLLGQQDIRVGALLSWTDRILSFFQEGNFLGAIDLARSYYVGTAPGNKSNLPQDPTALKAVVGSKLRDLMTSSASYAFSEDRMTDGVTHYAPDGRGVDRTALFQGLVTTSVEASIALGDYDFLYEDLFDKYLNWGIETVFLDQLEPFILDGTLTVVPTFITQRLISKHEDRGEYSKAERLIWHVDPASLDVNQAIKVCLKYELYDALVYLYTQTLGDFVSPLVELIGLVRKVQKAKKEMLQTSLSFSGVRQAPNSTSTSYDSELERLIPDAYKVYAYLGNVLSGLAYPSGQPMSPDSASKAKQEVYQFLFYGHSTSWNGLVGRDGMLGGDRSQQGQGNRADTLVLTADEEGGIEPTYPYLRLLLRFDAESLLHTLDIAFEDSFLNEVSRNISRQEVVNILLQFLSPFSVGQMIKEPGAETSQRRTIPTRTLTATGSIFSSSDFSPSDVTFINIFIARNVPKYPQFIQMAPNRLQDILIGLAVYGDDRDGDGRLDSTDHTATTTEDRQLAAEFLLSAYTPHDRDSLVMAFEHAGFYRILRTWYKNDHKWTALISTYLRDPAVSTEELFKGVEHTLAAASHWARKLVHTAGRESSAISTLPPDLLSTAVDSLPQLLERGVTATAYLVDTYLPGSHPKALSLIQSQKNDWKCFAYLRCLVEPGMVGQYEEMDEEPPETEVKDQNKPAAADIALPDQRRHRPIVLSQSRFVREPRGPSLQLDFSARYHYVALMCRYNSHHLIKLIETLPSGYVEIDRVVEITEAAGAFDVVLWLLNRSSRLTEALERFEEVGLRHTELLMNYLMDPDEKGSENPVTGWLEGQAKLVRMGIELCKEHSSYPRDSHVSLPPPEEMWFLLLRCQVEMVQSLNSISSQGELLKTLNSLRNLIQETFATLVSQTTSQEISLPRLFKRLVESTSKSRTSAKGLYSEFRIILTGMLDLYRSESDCLTLSNRLVERDLFDTIDLGLKSRQRGWRSSGAPCSRCGQPLLRNGATELATNDSSVTSFQISILRSGDSYHSGCV